MAKSNLATRFLTAGIGGPTILVLLYFGPPWGWLAFVLAAGAVGGAELFGMTHPGDRPSQWAGVVLTCGVTLYLWFFATDARALMALVLCMPLLSVMLVLWRLGDIKTAAARVASGCFGPLYLGGGLGALALLRRAGPDGPSYIVLSLVLAWLSDTGAYFAGRFLGKHKLYEEVSPKKTVEGSFGGLAAGILGALLGHFFYLRSLPILDGILLAIVGGGLGQVGDLGESLLKRSVGVKDSGGIIPGHGGLLNRVDALLVTATMTYLYILWWRT